MNPTLLLAVILGWGATVGGAFLYGVGVGQDQEIATQAREDKIAQISRAAAAMEAASAIAGIKVNHTTIRQNAAKEIIRDPIYLDCNHPDAVRRLLDSALANGAAASAPAGGGKLPPSDAAR